MKVCINIEIKDNTSAEVCAANGMSMEKMRYMYEQGFSGIMQGIVHPGVKWGLQVQITDNTKQEAQHGEE